jgi:predicted lipase
MHIRTLIMAAAQAYKRQPSLKGYSAMPVFKGHSQAFIYTNDKNIIIAFRGTEGDNLLDWWTDLKFRKRRIPNIPGRWHRGFIAATQLVLLQLLSRVHFEGRNRKVYITGHSMGAAMAGVFAAYLARMGLDKHVDGIALFGCPRFANHEAAAWLSKTYKGLLHRWIVIGDRVTTVPPFAFGYRHVGEKHVLTGPKKTILDRFRIISQRLLRWKSHTVTTYIKKIGEL